MGLGLGTISSGGSTRVVVRRCRRRALESGGRYQLVALLLWVAGRKKRRRLNFDETLDEFLRVRQVRQRGFARDVATARRPFADDPLRFGRVPRPRDHLLVVHDRLGRTLRWR